MEADSAIRVLWNAPFPTYIEPPGGLPGGRSCPRTRLAVHLLAHFPAQKAV